MPHSTRWHNSKHAQIQLTSNEYKKRCLERRHIFTLLAEDDQLLRLAVEPTRVVLGWVRVRRMIVLHDLALRVQERQRQFSSRKVHARRTRHAQFRQYLLLDHLKTNLHEFVLSVRLAQRVHRPLVFTVDARRLLRSSAGVVVGDGYVPVAVPGPRGRRVVLRRVSVRRAGGRQDHRTPAAGEFVYHSGRVCEIKVENKYD